MTPFCNLNIKVFVPPGFDRSDVWDNCGLGWRTYINLGVFEVAAPVVVGFDVTIAIPVEALTVVALADWRLMVLLLFEEDKLDVLSSSSVKSITPFVVDVGVVLILLLFLLPPVLLPVLFSGCVSFARVCDNKVVDNTDGTSVS